MYQREMSWHIWERFHRCINVNKINIFKILFYNECYGYSVEEPVRCASNIYLMEKSEKSPRRGGSNEYPQSMFLSRNKKNNV